MTFVVLGVILIAYLCIQWLAGKFLDSKSDNDAIDEPPQDSTDGK